MPQAVRVSAGTPQLAIVSWNLHGDEGDLAALTADLSAGRLTDRLPANVVLLLQEASPATSVEGLHVFFAPARATDGIERGNAIISSLPLADTRGIELPKERQRRVAAVATIRVGSQDLMLVNVHLENRSSWWTGGLPGDRARARQMEALLGQLPHGPGLLGGDLNVWLGTQERAYQAAAASFPDALNEQPPWTFRERLALDHLFYRLPRGWKASHARAPSRYGSDHFPLVGVLVSP